MKLSFSNIAWQSDEDTIILPLLKQYHFAGLEIAPSRIVAENPYEHLTKVKSIQNAIHDEYGLTFSSMQSILFGRQEKLFGTENEKSILMAQLKKAIDFAAGLEIKNLVFGSPRNRVIPANVSANGIIPFFEELGEYALQHHTVLSLEANPPIYQTNFLNTTAEAINFIKSIHSEGIKLNLDTGTMIENNEDLLVLEKDFTLIQHVHISEPNLLPIKQRPLHRGLGSFLKSIGYERYISVEMKRDENNPLEAIGIVLDYICGVFAS